jgi:hypothetical protein
MMLMVVSGALWIWAAVQDRTIADELPTALSQAAPSASAAPDAPDGRTPDLVLLRVQAAFLEHDLRLNATYEDRIQGGTTHTATDLDVRVAIPIDTLWMVGVLANYRWLEEIDRPNENGAAISVFGRVQLIQEPEFSYAFNVQVSSPNKGVENDKTQIDVGVAGFEDLDALLGLDRVGLYGDLEFQHSTGRGQVTGGNQLSYVVSLAKTWTQDLLGAGRFTLFAELGGTTQLDQGTKGHTTITGTPGLRLDPSPAHALIAGVDFPLTHPHGFGELFRISYVYSF